MQPRLIESSVPAQPVGSVLVLHGGGSRRGSMMVSPTQLSVLRMVPIAHRIARATDDRLAVFRLLNSVRGWDSRHTPVDDVRWALSRLRDRFGAAHPVSLVGHSLGGRAALLSAGEPPVRSVVALAPWVYADEGGRLPPGRQILIVHGTRDRIAAPTHSAAVARTLAATADVGYVSVDGGSHSMLRHHAVFDGLAADFVAATMLDRPAGPVIGRVLAGESWLTV